MIGDKEELNKIIADSDFDQLLGDVENGWFDARASLIKSKTMPANANWQKTFHPLQTSRAVLF